MSYKHLYSKKAIKDFSDLNTLYFKYMDWCGDKEDAFLDRFCGTSSEYACQRDAYRHFAIVSGLLRIW